MDIIYNFNLWFEIIGWLGNIGFLIGAIDLAAKRRMGWIWQAYGNWAYIVVAFEKSLYSLLFLDGILFVINVIGWWKWRDKKSKKRGK